MVTIELDQSRNLFIIRYSEHVGPNETERALADVRLTLGKVERSFRLLVDLLQLQSMDVLCAPHIENAMDMFNEKGVCEIIRIIPDPRLDIGLQIMSYFHYSGDVRIVTCETVGEAMNLLAK